MKGLLPKSLPRVWAPPVKCQGIKTKLVDFIARSIVWDGVGRWIEPFLGSGVVLFNLLPERCLASDTNAHIIRLYQDIQTGAVTPKAVRDYLTQAGAELAKHGGDYYYAVRRQFNEEGGSLRLLFLNRSCFNGVMRFNSRGDFNVPFGHKPARFSKAYVTKIANQVAKAASAMAGRDWVFRTQDWRTTLKQASPEDFVYLDPPYIGRHTDYYNQWTEEDAQALARVAHDLPCGVALSMWKENRYRENGHLAASWADYVWREFSHFYHVGPTENLRNQMTEVLAIKPGWQADSESQPVLRKATPATGRRVAVLLNPAQLGFALRDRARTARPALAAEPELAIVRDRPAYARRRTRSRKRG
ncbi:MAG: Dam family site-specific DNA-(adenine-N6)-methyltransferase [candidate division WOR-3 bacterium]